MVAEEFQKFEGCIGLVCDDWRWRSM